MSRSLLLLVFCAGCAEIPREEYAYQFVHLIDTAQTVQIARSSCFDEDWMRPVIGEHPSTSVAIAWGVGFAVGHAMITKYMVRHDWPRWMYNSWQAFSTGGTMYNVKNNFDQGIGVFDSDC